LLEVGERVGCDLRVVDLSADFRHSDPAEYSAIYGAPHGAPGRLSEFFCGLPDLEPRAADGGDGRAALPEGARHVAHPGCFTTAATLALAPLVAGGWLDPESTATVIAVTGSTGAGRTPTPTTHHPERRSDLFAYAPMAHRHEPEMRALLARAARSARATSGPGGAAGGLRSAGGGLGPEIAFVPQSGPFARGIHATISARLVKPADTDAVLSSLSSFYGSPSSSLSSLDRASSSFVFVSPRPPRLQSVVGTNRCDLSVAVRGDRLVAFSAIDNLVKGAAGGGVQWMNRLFGLPDAAGLALPGLGWL
jgi:N-acetyl-gamma-glutamyl-phosphate reductase